MTPNELLLEIAGARKRIAGKESVDAKTELAGNVYPLLHMLSETYGHIIVDLHERLEQCEGTIVEYLAAQESMILPELATQIHDFIGQALRVADMVIDVESPVTAEVAAKAKKVADLRERAAELRDAIADVTLVAEDGEPEDDSAERALSGEYDDDQLTPVEVPRAAEIVTKEPKDA